MKTLTELLDRLREVNPSAPEGVVAFEAALAQVVAMRAPESVVPLLGLLRDDHPYDEMMFSIIHGIEVFHDRIYVNQVLSCATSLCKDAPRWASIIFIRILNSESTKNELVRQLESTDPDTKTAIRKLMESINNRGAQFAEMTSAVLAVTAR